MKTYIIAITATIAMTLSLLSESISNEINYNAEHNYPALCCLISPIIEDEPYVNDIPFDTEKIVNSIFFQLEDEDYIDDIPFNTKKIVKNLK